VIQEQIEKLQTSRWPAVVVALATIIVFARLCSFDFSWWDDTKTIHHNPWFQQPALEALKHYWSHCEFGLYIPVTYTAWIGLGTIGRLQQADAKDISLNPWVFHSANVLVHVISALLVYALLRKLVKNQLAACMGALLFALHPVQMESVAWISGLKDVLAGCLSLAAILCYVVRAMNHAQCHPERYSAKDLAGRATGRSFASTLRMTVGADLLGTIFFIAAMLAKPSACMVPLIAICIDRWIIGRSWRDVFASSIVWILLAIPVLVVARIAQDVSEVAPAPIYARPFIFTDSITFYLYKLICPIWLGLDYGRLPAVLMQHPWFYFTWPIPLMIALLIWRSGRRWLIAAATISVVAILPISGLFTFEFQMYSTTADHYLYMAMLGPAIALAFALREFDRPFVRAIAAVALLALGARSFVQAGVWKDDVTLFSHAIRVNPHSFLSHHNLGSTYFLAGDYDRALQEFEAATAINPDFALSYDNASNILAIKGDIDDSIAAAEKSLAVRERLLRFRGAKYPEDQGTMGKLLMTRHEYARAIEHFQAALRAKPEDSESQRELQIAMEKLNAPATQSTQPSAR
jgi:tetratricopeptide (TPR) repeat protein